MSFFQSILQEQASVDNHYSSWDIFAETFEEGEEKVQAT